MAPSRIMAIAITQAKIGRSIKKRAIGSAPASGHGFDRSASLHPILPLDDHLFAGAKVRKDEYAAANDIARRHAADVYPILLSHHADLSLPAGIAGHRLLWHAERTGSDEAGQAGAYEHARQQPLTRVIDGDAYQYVAGARIYRYAREQDMAFHGMHLAARGHDLDKGIGLTGCAQVGEAIRWLAQVDINAVDLLNNRQGINVGNRHQCAFRDSGCADATGDWRRHARKADVDLPASQRRAGLRDLGRRLIARGDGVVIALASDRIRRDKRLQPSRLCACS